MQAVYRKKVEDGEEVESGHPFRAYWTPEPQFRARDQPEGAGIFPVLTIARTYLCRPLIMS